MSQRRLTVGLVGGATAFSLLGDQALYAVLPVYLDTLGLSAVQVGLLLSANRWVRLVTNPLAHRVLERVDARGPLLAALALGALTTAAYAATFSFTVLLIARLLWGLAWSFIRQGGVMWIMAATPAELTGRTMGVYNGVSRVGSVAGLFGGALLVDLVGFSPAMLVLGAVTVASVPLVQALRRDGRVDDRPAPEQPPGGRGSAVFLALGFCIGVVGPGFVMSTLGFLLGEHVGDDDWLGFATAATLTGALLAVRFGLDTLAAPWLGATTDRLGVRRASSIYFAIGAAALAGAAATETLAMLVILVLGFFTSATALQAGVAGYASRLGGALFSRYVTALDVGAAAGPLVAWIALDRLGRADVGLLLGAGFYGAAVLIAGGVAFPAGANDSSVEKE